jgi:hypothetical protein
LVFIGAMLALGYLAVVIVLGDRIRGKFWPALSPLQRWAAAFLVGILLSTWLTYLFAVAFAASARPLVWANLFFFIVAGFSLLLLGRFDDLDSNWAPTTKLNWHDGLFVAAFLAISSWLMFGTLSMVDGEVLLASVVWNDFGPNLALMQSFALGHNFPAEYPYFIGEPIRYHFLFWFQAGNLEFLGLNLAVALNLLSAMSMLALLISIMTLGEALFGSRVIGGLAALLLFFHGSLSYVPFLQSQHSVGGAIHAITHLDRWLSSGFPYKGEDWGIWSPSILYVQRHLLGAVGILCLVLTFLVESYRQESAGRERATEEGPGASPPLRSFIFSGALIGLLVCWNSPIFVSGLTLIGCLFLFLLRRVRLALLLGTALLIGIPQVLLLGFAQTTHRFSILHWGYTMENPTFGATVTYFLFTFGPKLVLACGAIILLRTMPRVFFLAMASLVVLAFGTQLSVDIMNNQKFLYLWLVLLNLFVAYTLARIYRVRVVGKVAAILLGASVIAGGAIELFCVHNDHWVAIPFRNNALSRWLRQNTKPGDVFLTDRFVHHPILMNGRRIFYGWPYFPWSMGYETAKRDATYKLMLSATRPDLLLDLLKSNGIDYVAIDNALRQDKLGFEMDEKVFASILPRAFQDSEKRFGSLTIYKVPR